MSFCVLDASFVFPWLFEDETTTAADDMLALVEAHGAVVPTLWHTGIANGLGMAERRNRITPLKARGAEAQEGIGLLDALPLVVDETRPAQVFATLLHLMRTHRLTAYDATYLELALRRGLPLATKDGALRRAAQASGVELVTTAA